MVNGNCLLTFGYDSRTEKHVKNLEYQFNHSLICTYLIWYILSAKRCIDICPRLCEFKPRIILLNLYGCSSNRSTLCVNEPLQPAETQRRGIQFLRFQRK